MSHEDDHSASTREKIVRMANQIATFFASKPHAMGVEGTAEHINKFWDPRMRRTFFELIDAGGERFLPMAREAAAKVRRPGEPPSPGDKAQVEAGAPGGKGVAAGETPSRIAASQG